VNIPEAPIFTIYPVVTNINCFGAHNGSVILNIVGGVAPVSLSWLDSPSAGNVRNNLGPGTYTVNITDSKPCNINRTFTIVEPQLLVLAANVTNALDCNDANSGAINLMVSGGTPPFTYAWSNGATTEDLATIPAGNYLVTVTDSRGCSKSIQKVVFRPSPIVANVLTNTIFDCATKFVKQTFTASILGGVPPYNLVWSSGTISGANNEIMNTTQNGMVFLQATDAIGCSTNYSFNVNIPTLGTANFTSSSYAYSTFGTYSISDPIQFTNTATGDFVSIAWNFGDGSVSNELNPLHTFVGEGSYVITQTVTYPFGCIDVHVYTIMIDKGYKLMMPTGFTPNSDGVNDTFSPVFIGLKSVELSVYDTWGEMIYYEIGDTLNGWDGKVKGKDSENGNYYYKVSATTFYGTVIHENGPFTLIK
jgi:gliding motility-associated-like protein